MKFWTVKFASFWIILVLLSFVYSANLDDEISLKNGSKIKGRIIELSLEEKIKIETSDGSLFVYSIPEIEKITVTVDSMLFKNGSLIRKNQVEIIPDTTIKLISSDGTTMFFEISQIEEITLAKPVPEKGETLPATKSFDNPILKYTKYKAEEKFNFHSIGGQFNYVNPEGDINNTIGIGINSHLYSLKQINIFAYFDYWATEEKSRFSESKLSQLTIAGMAKYLFYTKSKITPFLGAGLGVNMTSAESEYHYQNTYFPSSDFSTSEDNTDVSLFFLGGIDYCFSPRMDFVGELKYTSAGIKSFYISAGINYYLKERELKEIEITKRKGQKRSRVPQKAAPSYRKYSNGNFKSSRTATVLSAILPGAGHIYAGESRTGLYLMGFFSSAIGVVITYGPWKWEETETKANDYFSELNPGDTPGAVKAFWYASVGISTLTWLYAVLDSGPAVRRYNNRVSLSLKPVNGKVLPGICLNINL